VPVANAAQQHVFDGTTSPVVQSLVSCIRMMDSELPPLPAGSPGKSADSEISNSPSRATRRHRRHSTIEREINHLRDLLQSERRRADEAETRTRETLAHLKTINDARLNALQEAAQATEKLKYEVQIMISDLHADGGELY
jgi:hypothetical protein